METLAKNPKAQKKEIEACAQDFWRWTWYVFTKDPRAAAKGKPAHRRFPDKEYLRILAGAMDEHPRLAIRKSRQVLISWLVCAKKLHRILFTHGASEFLQRKSEDKVKELISRVRYIIKYLPEWMVPSGLQSLTQKIAFGSMASEIVGLPQGAAQVEGFTGTGGTFDEFHTLDWDDAKETLEVATPALAFLHLVMTADAASYAKTIVGDGARQGPEHFIMRGLSCWDGPQEFKVYRLLHEADPEKDPEGAGADWFAEERPKFTDSAWETEMRDNWDVTPGSRMLLTFDPEIHVGLPPYIPGVPLLTGWDFGYKWPFLVVNQFNEHDQLCVLGEFWMQDADFATVFLPRAIEWLKENFSPDLDQYEAFGDPDGARHKLSEKTAVDHIEEETGWHVIHGMSGEKERMAILRGLLAARSDGRPGIIFHEYNCPVLIAGARGQFVESKTRPEESNQKSHPTIDAFDALGYILFHILGEEPEEKPDPIYRKKTQEEEKADERRRERAGDEGALTTAGTWDYSTGRY